MIPPVRLGSAAAVAAAATFGLSGVAGASAGEKSFAQTYPLASRMCAAMARGEGPKRLRHSSASVLADCATLQANFTAARTAVLAEDASIARARASERSAIRFACAGRLDHRPSCVKARHKHGKAIEQLNRQHIQAVHTYYHAAEAARRAFWTAIHALPGGARVHADAPVPERSD
jgi:hypothetical protein